MLRVLFICMGNICRSPTAETVFRHSVQQAGLEHLIECDSAGPPEHPIRADAQGGRARGGRGGWGAPTLLPAMRNLSGLVSISSRPGGSVIGSSATDVARTV